MPAQVVNNNTSRRVEIVHTALALIDESGLGKLTMKRIANRMGLSEAALYRYFPTKDDLLFAIHDYFREFFVVSTQEIAARTDLSAPERLKAVWLYLLENNQKLNGFPVRLLAEVIATSDEAHLQKLKQITQASLDSFDTLVAEVLPADCPLRPREFVWLMIGVPAALAIWGHLLDDQETETKVRDDLIPYLMNCLTRNSVAKMSAAD